MWGKKAIPLWGSQAVTRGARAETHSQCQNGVSTVCLAVTKRVGKGSGQEPSRVLTAPPQTHNRSQYWRTSEDSAGVAMTTTPRAATRGSTMFFSFMSPAAKAVSQEVSHRAAGHGGCLSESDRHGQVEVLPANSCCHSPRSSPVPPRSLLQLHLHSRSTEPPTRQPIGSSLPDLPLVLL